MSSISDFQHTIDRRSVPGEKWGRYHDRDVIPMWVADMDFAAPPVVLDALHTRIDHGVFGYADAWPGLADAVIAGIERDHGWRIESDWLVWLPGVVTGFNLACRIVGEPGDGIFTATPVYPPFLSAPGNADRKLQQCPLVLRDGRWEWDWASVERTLTPESRLFMLCNPHNPVGRVFSREELQRIAIIAERHDMVICSDEIHCGLVLDDTTPHIPIASLDQDVARRTITLMAPSKTWNIAALYCAFAIIPDPTLRARYRRAMRGIVPHPNVLGMVATEAAYAHGEAWRLELLEVLRQNRQKVVDEIARLPGLACTMPEATYLAWIDCRQLIAERNIDSPVRFFEEAGVGLSDGAPFGTPGFVRLNFGCPPAILDEGLTRIRKAVSGRPDHASPG